MTCRNEAIEYKCKLLALSYDEKMQQYLLGIVLQLDSLTL